MANTTHVTEPENYYVPHDSHWPIIGSFALFTLMLGAIGFLNEWGGGWVFLPGAEHLRVSFIGSYRTCMVENR